MAPMPPTPPTWAGADVRRPRLQALTPRPSTITDLRIAVLEQDAVRAQYGIERSAPFRCSTLRLSGGRSACRRAGTHRPVLQGTHAPASPSGAFGNDLFGRVWASRRGSCTLSGQRRSCRGRPGISLVTAAAGRLPRVNVWRWNSCVSPRPPSPTGANPELALSLVGDASRTAALTLPQAEGRRLGRGRSREGRQRD